MRLAVSNLAWPTADDAEALALLASLGVDGVEVAPAKVTDAPRYYRAMIEDCGLKIPALQGIMFNRPDLNLFGDHGPLEDHFSAMADLASELGAEVMVFGAPRNRLRGGLSLTAAWNLAVDTFRDLAFVSHGVIIGIEPIPLSYGCDFLTNWMSVWAMVREVCDPGVMVHLDSGCVGDEIVYAIEEASPVHFHFSQPGLDDFSQPLPSQAAAATALRATNYQGWATIEMRQRPDWKSAITRAVTLFRPLLFD